MGARCLVGSITRVLALALTCLGIAAGTAACSDQENELRIFAAASLQDVLPALLRDYQSGERGQQLRFVTRYGGSQALATQIELGAQVDLFLPANREQLERLAGAGMVRAAVAFAGNRLVVAVPDDSEMVAIEDLARPGTRIAAGAPEVPIGLLTARALAQLDPGLAEAIGSRVVTRDPNVRVALSRVELGEVDAAFVYQTDLSSATGVRALKLPPALSPLTNRYWAATLSEASPETASFVAYLAGDSAQSILARAGFESLP